MSALMADVSMNEAPSQDGAAAAPDGAVPVEHLAPNPDQPRRRFAPEALEELSASIAEKGVIQPLIVRPMADGPAKYEIVAGERRWRAAQMAQLHEVPVIIREFDDTEVLEIAIIENIQRADLNPVEEALGYRQLMDRFGHTQEKLAEALSKSRSHIANLMRLLQLPEDVQEHLREGRISAGHARALITSDDPSGLAREVISKGLSVRDTEKLTKKPKVSAKKAPPATTKDADTRALEQDLSANLKMSVDIAHQGDAGSGKLVISYKSLEDLDELCRILTAMPRDGSR